MGLLANISSQWLIAFASIGFMMYTLQCISGSNMAATQCYSQQKLGRAQYKILFIIFWMQVIGVGLEVISSLCFPLPGKNAPGKEGCWVSPPSLLAVLVDQQQETPMLMQFLRKYNTCKRLQSSSTFCQLFKRDTWKRWNRSEALWDHRCNFAWLPVHLLHFLPP